MMRFMPFMFLIFLYFFSSALVLYWTIQNLMTILQTLITKGDRKSKQDTKAILNASAEIEEESEPVRNELSDEEKAYRNLLGLRSKDQLTASLEKIIVSGSEYSPSKLEGMTEARRKQAEKKKERLETA